MQLSEATKGTFKQNSYLKLIRVLDFGTFLSIENTISLASIQDKAATFWGQIKELSNNDIIVIFNGGIDPINNYYTTYLGTHIIKVKQDFSQQAWITPDVL